MHKSKSLILLKTFSEAEIDAFSDFLESPYFNRNTRVTKLFSVLKNYYPDFTSKNIEKENLYKKMFPGKAYNEQVMKNLISELLKLEKTFMAVNGFISNKFRYSLQLVNTMLRRDTGPIIIKEIENFRDELKNRDITSDQINLFSHLLEESLFTFYLTSNKQQEASEMIERSGEQLTLYFLKTLFRLSMNNHINSFSFNVNIKYNYLDSLISSINLPEYIKFFENKDTYDAVFLKLSHYALLSVKNTGDIESYNLYYSLLFDKIDILNTEDKKLFLHFMESLCAQKINAGKTNYYHDLFSTFQYQINNELYSADLNKITVMKFRNIFISSIRCGEYGWAEKFIHDFKGKLDKDNRKNIVELALAQLNFERGKFEDTLEHLKKIKTDQVYFKVDVRHLSLMSLYELGYFENAVSLIDSFRKLLTNNELFTEQYSRKNINFINSVNNLIRLRADNSPNGIEQLLQKINSFEVLSNKKWLLKKVEELKKGH